MRDKNLTLKKPYKAKLPEQTINEIRNILLECGIFLKEEYYSHGDFYSCSLIVYDDNIGNIDIRTNGKGLNLKYAFASAYAEFMERIQNNYLFDHLFYATPYHLKNLLAKSDSFRKELTNNIGLDFLYDPEEELIPAKDVVMQNFKFLSKLFNINNRIELLDFITVQLGYEELICVPFFDNQNSSIIKLPIELILKSGGSNGMCAGNTPEEAIIQGICEIFERYAIREIYYKGLTPPTIHRDHVKGTKVYELVNNIEKEQGYKVILKDCSLGIGLPVMGVLILNPEDSSYNMTLGSDPWPITALERCLTEIYQNPIGIFFNEISLSEDVRLEKDLSNSDKFNLNYDKISQDGTGKWPNSIFLPEPSYDFTGFNLSYGKKDTEDLKHLIGIVERLNSSLYIRDVSFMGFNSYLLCAPGISQISNNKDYYLCFERASSHNHIALDIKNACKDDIEKLTQTLDKTYQDNPESGIKFSQILIYNDHPELSDLDIELVLCMLYFKMSNHKKAFDYISIFLKDKLRSQYQYYYCIKDYLYLKTQSRDEKEILGILSIIYLESLAQEVISDFESPDKIFQFHQLPSCFNCNSCEVKANCRYFSVLRIVKKIQEIQVQNPITYKELNELKLSKN